MLPTDSPLRIPVALGTACLALTRALDLERPPGPKLRGAFGAALMRRSCVMPAVCRPGPPEDDEPGARPHPCQGPAECPARLLLRPHSTAQARDHASPLALSVAVARPDLLDVGVALWGRRALALKDLVEQVLIDAGRFGLLDGRGAAPFAADIRWEFDGTLHQWLAGQGHGPGGPLLLQLVEPVESRSPDLASWAANAVHDLVQWDLEDSGESELLGKRGCDALAGQAREAARSAFRGVVVEDAWLEEAGPGARRSRTNRQRFEPLGVRGYVRLGGELEPAWPWLSLLTLRGAGGRRSFGLGGLRLWRPAVRLQGC